MTTQPKWMLYGAYGKTGRLILDEAVRRGHTPVLAGRDGAQLAALGQATGLQTRCVSIEDNTSMRAALSDIACVLLAAGPYHLTGPAMRRACLDARCSYLDVNGEVEDFSQAMSSDAEARAAGIAIVAGVGYGVAFGECLAAYIKSRLQAATSLRLSFATKTAGRSRAATLSMAATLAAGGRDIYRGRLRTRAIASPTWSVTFADGSQVQLLRFAAAPMAELVAAHRSTGIANITTGIPLSRTVAVALRVAGPMFGRILARAASRASTPAAQPASAPAVDGLRSHIWAHATDDGGGHSAAILETGEGYGAAAQVAVRAVELQLRAARVGALTPVQAFGANLALLVPGTCIQEL